MTSKSDHSPQAVLADRVIQDLYGIGLKVEYSIALLEDSPVQTRVALDAVISDLGQLIDILRSEVSGLVAPGEL